MDIFSMHIKLLFLKVLFWAIFYKYYINFIIKTRIRSLSKNKLKI